MPPSLYRVANELSWASSTWKWIDESTIRMKRCSTIAAALCWILVLASAAIGEQKTERGDDPGGAAQFYLQLHGGAVPQNALPQAIERVRQMRGEVAQRVNIQPWALAAFANLGHTTARIGGIPVGPLPAEPAANITLPGPATLRDLPAADAERIQQSLRPQAMPLNAMINPADWLWLGPGNIGGRIRSILISPTNPQVIWIGGVAGGVWRSRDAGVTWAPLYDFMASLVISCMALDPTNPNKLYVGTGEGFYNGDAFRGFGIFRSNNGGDTWEHLQSTAGADFQWINRIAISPNGQVFLVGTRSGMFRSADQGQHFQRIPMPMDPNQQDPFKNEILDVKFHPNNSTRCIASARGSNVFYSNDGGNSWSAGNGIPHNVGFDGRVELAYALANPDVAYASADRGDGEVYRSTDGGQTFQNRSAPGHLSGQGWYANTIWAGDSSDPNLVVVGGLDLFRSTDGGTTFTQISRWQDSPTSAHADHHAIISHPGYDGETNRTVFFGNDGGIYRAKDILAVQPSSGWQELNNGLGITQFYGAGGNLQTGEIVAGAQDNGTLLSRPSVGSEGWTEIFGGDGGYSAADPANRVFFGEYVYLQIHRSRNGGQSSSIYSGIHDAGNPSAALFIAPFILDPNNSSAMLAGGQSLWRSNNVQALAPTWTAIKPALGATPISAIAVARGNSDVVWVGHAGNSPSPSDNGAIFKTANATSSQPNWTRVANAQLPRRHCTRVVIDPADRNRLFATFGEYANNNLWATEDGGSTWTSLGVGSLPVVPNYDLKVHPDDPNILILANEVGLFVSNDRGMTWSPTNRGPTNCVVFELLVMDHSLVAVTHGRGLFKITLSGGPSPPPIQRRPAKQLAD